MASKINVKKLTAYDIDPFKDFYPWKDEDTILNLVCPTGLGYPLRDDVPPEAVFTEQDHYLFAKACGKFGLNWALVSQFMGRPQWAIAAYWEFCEYVAGNQFLHGHKAFFESRGFTKKEINHTIGLLYQLVHEGKWEARFGRLWRALLEVEANGGVVPQTLRDKFTAEQARAEARAAASSSTEAAAQPPSSSSSRKAGSRKKAAKKARKAASAAAKASVAGTGGQAAAEKQSRFLGVSWYKAHNQWHAMLMKDRKSVLNEYFEDEEAAARAYDRAARRHLGPNAVVNYASEASSVFLNPKAGAVKYGGSDGTVASDFRGVAWDKRGQVWRAQIKVNGKNVSLGSFETPLEAAKAYDDGARKYHGSSAIVNFDSEGNRTSARCRILNDGKPKAIKTGAATTITTTAAADAAATVTTAAGSAAPSASATGSSPDHESREAEEDRDDAGTATAEDDDQWEALAIMSGAVKGAGEQEDDTDEWEDI